MAVCHGGNIAVTAVRIAPAPAPVRPSAPPMPGGMTPAAGSIRLASEHFAAAVVYLVAGAAGLVWIAPELASGTYLSPHVAGVTHLFTLGFITMTIFGALYQLLPVALGAPIRWTRVGHASFWTFAPGVGLFAAGVAWSALMIQHAGIALVAVGVLLAVANIAATLPRARTRDVTWSAVALAITFLATTLVLGILLLHNLHSGFIADMRVRALAAHLHVAAVGWALVMMIGVSHRLLPMFLLAHGGDVRWTRRALICLATGVPLLTIGIVTGFAAVAWLGAAMLEAGVFCFIRQAYELYRVRVKRKLDVGMQFVRAAIGFLTASALVGPLVLYAGASSGRLSTAYVILGILGGIVMYITGFFYKIVPLLAWTVHYRGRLGKETVPAIAETFSSRAARVQLGLMASAIIVLTLGIGTGSVLAAQLGALLFLSAVLVFATQLARVARGPAR